MASFTVWHFCCSEGPTQLSFCAGTTQWLVLPSELYAPKLSIYIACPRGGDDHSPSASLSPPSYSLSFRRLFVAFSPPSRRGHPHSVDVQNACYYFAASSTSSARPRCFWRALWRHTSCCASQVREFALRHHSFATRWRDGVHYASAQRQRRCNCAVQDRHSQ